MPLGQALKTPTGIAGVVGAVAGVLLLLTLFMFWGQDVCPLEPCPYLTGWAAFRVLDIPIALLAAAAAVVAVLTLLGQTARTGLVLAALGLLATVLILIAPFVERTEARPRFDWGGGWTIGLLAALVVLACGATIWVLSSGVLESDE